VFGPEFDWKFTNLQEAVKKCIANDHGKGCDDVATMVSKDDSGVSDADHTAWCDLEGLTVKTLAAFGDIEQLILGSHSKSLEKDTKLSHKVLETLLLAEIQECFTPDMVLSKVFTSLHPGESKENEGGKPSKENELLRKFVAKVYTHYKPRELLFAEEPDLLCRCDNLMLMYGGGTLLLKDTMFELRKGKRYGVVGRNGTGKTTLMNLLAKGEVPQVPKSMTCLHVKPEVLDKFMGTKCKDYMAMENPDQPMKKLEETLTNVQFPENLWESTIGELSGGWRMRLLIAGVMMKSADVLLLRAYESLGHFSGEVVVGVPREPD
jgi:hypothetical protein